MSVPGMRISLKAAEEYSHTEIAEFFGRMVAIAEECQLLYDVAPLLTMTVW